MIIPVVHQLYVFPMEQKRQSPIPTDLDRPVSLKISLQAMQVVARRIHIFRPAGHVKGSQQPAQPFRMFGLNTGFGARSGKALQPFMAVAPNLCIAYIYAIRNVTRKKNRTSPRLA